MSGVFTVNACYNIGHKGKKPSKLVFTTDGTSGFWPETHWLQPEATGRAKLQTNFWVLGSIPAALKGALLGIFEFPFLTMWFSQKKLGSQIVRSS